ncbi:helix-turn-helix domain-containing protein, partial [Salipiger thiooxidans]|uniref:helix-turn-helix domain-containing protein n=1 Tax=Salipiger thiooxidans TaxID=282683 RepID=UPI001A8D257E
MGAVYAQLSAKERVQIESWKLAKVPVREMARVLQRSKATIYREIKRNWFSDECLPGYDGYYGAAAHQKAANRRARQRK